jgi:hypothetical protein
MSRSRTAPRVALIVFPALLAGVLVVAARAQVSVEHVGARTCSSCHARAFEAWRSGPHARAYQVLAGASREDRACLRCHSPSRASGHAGVQCETCHGGGRHYFPEYVMRDRELSRLVGLRDPGPATCAECHDANSPRLVPFDYEKARERIRHW